MRVIQRALLIATSLPVHRAMSSARAPPADRVIEPHGGGAARSTVILLHGLGDTAAGWFDTVKHELAPKLRDTRWILPTAPTRPVTMNGGMPMPAWYDITSLAADRALERCDGLPASVARVHALVEAQVAAGVPAKKIVLAGFSQGGATSLFSGLSWRGGADASAAVGGVAVLSGYLPAADTLVAAPQALRDAQFHFWHGDEDGVVPLEYARDAETRVRALGARDIGFTVERGMGHSASHEEIVALAAFISRITDPAPPVTEADVRAMSAKELKNFLRAKNVDASGAVEKHELVSLALGAIQ
jgi:predicted esterase